MAAGSAMRDKETQIQRTYDGIRTDILAGAFWPGERLESRFFETKFNTSSTTVRMALSRLAGERLIESSALDGFHIPPITEGWLYDMYVSNRALLGICLDLPAGDLPADEPREYPHDNDATLATDALFNDIASATNNLELIALVSTMNDRLRSVRRFRTSAFPEPLTEIQSLRALWSRREIEALSAGLRQYHQIRIDHLRDVVQLANRRRR